MKHKIAVGICVILIILTVGFIWNNSRKTEEVSNQQSSVVTEKVDKVLSDNNAQASDATFKALMNKVRKAAHAIEFFILGIEISALSFILKKRFLPQSLWNILSSVLAIAVVDEAIQILSGRGPKVQDVLIDFCGAAIGFLLALLIRFIITSCRKGKRKYAKN